jgi:hypothetical protein
MPTRHPAVMSVTGTPVLSPQHRHSASRTPRRESSTSNATRNRPHTVSAETSHTYAQRHADNGTPVDVLRQLMDHRSIQTTGGYYITADRKRRAIETVGGLAIDKDGVPAPLIGSTPYQMRSVAVPFGNCIEPSNVKAGGKACPIRFQCAGCGFYRPDPSYIPAIEEHINSLIADREIASAIDAAPFVIDNRNAQIDAFRNVLDVMRRALQQLDGEHREQVEQASAVLRKARGRPAPTRRHHSEKGKPMTQAVKRTSADILREARRRDSDRKRDQVFRTVDAMKRDGAPITFAAVARAAQVSQWLVYAEGVREYIETARVAQEAQPVQAKRAGRSASEASLSTDFELAKQDNPRLRGELGRVTKALRERLGTNSKPHLLNRCGSVLTSLPRPTIGIAVRTLASRRKSLMRMRDSARPKTSWRPRAQA